jgi:hypothetical protein
MHAADTRVEFTDSNGVRRAGVVRRIFGHAVAGAKAYHVELPNGVMCWLPADAVEAIA